jgi:hypothetical protein
MKVYIRLIEVFERVSLLNELKNFEFLITKSFLFVIKVSVYAFYYFSYNKNIF